MRSRGSDKRFSVLLDEKTQAALNPELVCIEEHEAKPWCAPNEHSCTRAQIDVHTCYDVHVMLFTTALQDVIVDGV